jgi:hypothetical protein
MTEDNFGFELVSVEEEEYILGQQAASGEVISW